MLQFRRVSGAASAVALAAGLFLFGAGHAPGQGGENRVAVEAGNQNWDIVAPDADASPEAFVITSYNQNWD
ncbi:hypothetical protein WDV06_18385 [Streptomyces racemochromogenes]|uniref:Uncharacterized protein n=1 Tax=Streptomyces racemochromogenes TaxID=67353 RepID=A0ABW7PF96_9ACTN